MSISPETQNSPDKPKRKIEINFRKGIFIFHDPSPIEIIILVIILLFLLVIIFHFPHITLPERVLNWLKK
jgi:hypothetical protein